MKFLKKLSSENTSTPVKSLLNSKAGGYELARSKKNIHASDLTKAKEYCPRETILRDITKKKLKDIYVPTALRITFDEGWDKQYRLCNDYLRDVIVGDWECRSCGATKKWSKSPASDCVGKYKCHWEYVEPRFVHAPTKAGGGIDAIIKTNKPKLHVCEIKIMAPSLFIPLKAPLAEHRLRTALYLKIIAESNHPNKDEVDTSEASVLYCLRGHGKKDDHGDISPFKEYIVKRNDSMVQEEISKARMVTFCRDTPGAIPQGVCSHALEKRAKECVVCKECFTGEYPPTVTIGTDGEPCKI